MSYTIDPGFTRPVATKNVAVTDWDYSSYTSPIVTGSDKHRVIKTSNKTSDLDRPAIIEIKRDFIEDAYKNTGINPQYRSPVKEGLSVKILFTTVKKITDSATGEYVYIPYRHTETNTWVLHPAIDASTILQDLKDSWGLWFPTDSVTANQIADILAGGPGMLDETSSS